MDNTSLLSDQKKQIHSCCGGIVISGRKSKLFCIGGISGVVTLAFAVLNIVLVSELFRFEYCVCAYGDFDYSS
jgi:hypothetical protein